jgi:hypothetical protein
VCFCNFCSLIKQNSDRILEEIYKDDFGSQSPNPSTLFYLSIAGVGNFSELIPSIGRPYNWAQELAGLHFPKENEDDPAAVSQMFPLTRLR